MCLDQGPYIRRHLWTAPLTLPTVDSRAWLSVCHLALKPRWETDPSVRKMTVMLLEVDSIGVGIWLPQASPNLAVSANSTPLLIWMPRI